MKIGSNANLISGVLVLLALAAVGISCSRVKQLARGDSQSEKVKRLNYGVPAGYQNAEFDPYRDKGSAFIVILTEPGQVVLHDADAPAMDLPTFSERVKDFAAGRSGPDRMVYIAAVVGLDSGAFLDAVDVLRKNEIDTVRLLASSRTLTDDDSSYHEGAADAPGPDRFFEVRIRKDVDTDKPNPLTLVAKYSGQRQPILNNEPMRDEEEMSVRLREVFRERENNGVFRESTNEVEKTVLYQMDDGTSRSSQKYGDIVRMIDALKGAGASPIVLIDGSGLWQVPATGQPPSKLITSASPPPPVPKVISGGVLNGKATYLPKPPYPPAAKAVRASGTVTVQVTVDENGNVVQVNAVSGHPLLRTAAAAAAKQAKFAPTMLSGQRVKVAGVLTYNFSADTPQ